MRIQDLPTNAPLSNAETQNRWRVAFWCRCGHHATAQLADLIRTRPLMTMEGLVPRARCSECGKAGRRSEIVEAQLETVPLTSGSKSVYARVVYLAPGRTAVVRTEAKPLHHDIARANGR